jgi:hypothetical protein
MGLLREDTDDTFFVSQILGDFSGSFLEILF